MDKTCNARAAAAAMECKYQGLSLSLPVFLLETLNINMGLVPRFSGKPPGNSVRVRAAMDQIKGRPKNNPPTFRMPTRPILIRPQGPPPLCSALSRSLSLSRSDERYLKYLAGCSETVWRRRGCKMQEDRYEEKQRRGR